MIYTMKIETGGKSFFKIGYTTNIAVRVKDIQTASPFNIELVQYRHGERKDEKRVHEKVRSHRAKGEWFKNTPEVREVLGLHINPTRRVAPTEVCKARLFFKNNHGCAMDFDEFIAATGFSRNMIAHADPNIRGYAISHFKYEHFNGENLTYLGAPFDGWQEVIYHGMQPGFGRVSSHYCQTSSKSSA